jgi:hypothetical protein
VNSLELPQASRRISGLMVSKPAFQEPSLFLSMGKLNTLDVSVIYRVFHKCLRDFGGL